jgi:hypothetical protein
MYLKSTTNIQLAPNTLGQLSFQFCYRRGG